MSKYLYKDFLENHRIYHLAIGYWIRMLKQHIDGKEPIEYLNNRFNDGSLFYDGNPIINFAIPCKRKAVRIIQLSPQEYEEYYSSWTNEIEIESSIYQEKIIALTLTKIKKDKAVGEISRWLIHKDELR